MTTALTLVGLTFSGVALVISILSILVTRNIDARLRRTAQRLDTLDKDLRG